MPKMNAKAKAEFVERMAAARKGSAKKAKPTARKAPSKRKAAPAKRNPMVAGKARKGAIKSAQRKAKR